MPTRSPGAPSSPFNKAAIGTAEDGSINNLQSSSTTRMASIIAASETVTIPSTPRLQISNGS